MKTVESLLRIMVVTFVTIVWFAMIFFPLRPVFGAEPLRLAGSNAVIAASGVPPGALDAYLQRRDANERENRENAEAAMRILREQENMRLMRLQQEALRLQILQQQEQRIAQEVTKNCTFTPTVINGQRLVCQTCCYQPSGQCFTTCR